MTNPNLGKAIPVAVRKLVDQWITGAYGQEHLGVPMYLISQVNVSGEDIYRLEVDVTVVTTSPVRETVSVSVVSRSGEAHHVDQDSVVFFS